MRGLLPSDAEVATEMGISLDDLHAIFSQLSLVNVMALDELLHAGSEAGDRLSLVDTLEDTTADDPVEVAEAREMRHLLARAVNALPEREKIVSLSAFSSMSPVGRFGFLWPPRSTTTPATPTQNSPRSSPARPCASALVPGSNTTCVRPPRSRRSMNTQPP